MSKDYIINLLENQEEKEFYISARVVSLNSKSFIISDQTGEIEIYFDKKYANFKSGDIIEVIVKFSQDKYFLLDSKVLTSVVLNPVVDKNSSYYRLNKSNKKILEVLYKRQTFFKLTRDFFFENNFLELHTPTLLESPGVEKYLEPFWTSYISHSGEDKLLFMPTSPEFSLKEALASGLEKIFEIAKCFRNRGEDSILHIPEFFMLEWYRAYESYEKIMQDCESYILFLAKKLNKKVINFNKSNCMLDRVERVKLKDIFKSYDINLDDYTVNEKKFLKKVMSYLKISKKELKESSLTKEDLFFKFFLNYIEPTLGKDHPVIVYEYPIEMASLSKAVEDNPIYAKRFELYISGVELANAYEELTDPIEQEKRFKETIDFRIKSKKIPLKMPDRFLKVMRQGIPPSSGIALGLERLFMLMENIGSIKETNLILSHSIFED